MTSRGTTRVPVTVAGRRAGWVLRSDGGEDAADLYWSDSRGWTRHRQDATRYPSLAIARAVWAGLETDRDVRVVRMVQS